MMPDSPDVEKNMQDTAAPAADMPDVVVIGGGPAGSTAATLLADRGHDVVMFERAQHPRFHIGESLLPMNMPLFDRLGVRQQIEQIGITKYGAEFVSPWHEHTSEFRFAEAYDKCFPYAVQVRRSEFDELLFRHAASRGVRTFESHRVLSVEWPQGDERVCVKVRDAQGMEHTWRPRFVVDASGRDTVLASQLGLKLRSKAHASAAMFGHFSGARRLPGKQEGNISLFWWDRGWSWFIPLRDGTTSVGVVSAPDFFKTRSSDPSSFLLDTIRTQIPKLAERLQDATLMEPATATGNYAYDAKACRGDRYVLVGDAYAFIDPMFSSGVFLAMNSAFECVEALDLWLRGELREAERLFRRYDKLMRYGPKMYSWFIYRITSPVIRHLFMHPSNVMRLKEAMLSLLAGDLFRFTPIRSRLLAFKCIYYGFCLTTLPASIGRWLRRRRMIGDSLKEPLKFDERY